MRHLPATLAEMTDGLPRNEIWGGLNRQITTLWTFCGFFATFIVFRISAQLPAPGRYNTNKIIKQYFEMQSMVLDNIVLLLKFFNK